MKLDRGPFKWLLAAIASVGLSVVRRSLNLIYPDADGDWVHRQRGAIFYNRAYSSVSFDRVQAELFDFWCYEYKIRAGDIVVDIGAGVGDDVVVLARLVGSTGHVIAIEANPRTFRCLQKTIKANGLENVTTLQLAVTDRIGQLYIEESDVHLANRVGAASGARVNAATLDKILADLDLTEPTVVKMNVEGAETTVLRGAPRTLGTNAHWVISCHDFVPLYLGYETGYEDSATFADVTALLRQAGLEILPPRVDDRPWVPYNVYARRA